MHQFQQRFRNGAEYTRHDNTRWYTKVYRDWQRSDTGERVTIRIVTYWQWEKARVVGGLFDETWYKRSVMHWTDHKLDWFGQDEFVVREKTTGQYFWLDKGHGQMIPVVSLKEVMGEYFFEAPGDYNDPSVPYVPTGTWHPREYHLVSASTRERYHQS